MNTDKLMELERKWRAEADELDAMADRCSETTEHESRQDFQSRAERERNRADELAALRAEQAVGDEQRAHIETLRAVRSVFEGIPAPCAERDAIDAAIRALGTARQSEGVVLVPREPTEAMLAAVSGWEESVLVAEDATIEYPVSTDTFADAYRAMIAAAPGGEGEGKV